MGRATLTKIKNIVLGVGVLLAIGGGGVYLAHRTPLVHTVANAQHHVTQISYQGQTGVDALTLLKKYARVGVKHYSFGDFVTSINDSAGIGPKYWTFYVNGHQASVGAGAYRTKASDTLMWKLQ